MNRQLSARRLVIGLFPVASVGLAAGACGSDGSVDTTGEENTGQVVLALTNVPSNVHCLQVTVTGSRTDQRSFDVTPGAASTKTLKGLPTGNVTFNENAFSDSCASIGATSVATWVSDQVEAVLVPGVLGHVTVVLRPNGQAVVTSDFQDGGGVGTGGAPGAGGSTGTGGSTGAGGTCSPTPQATACAGRECGTVSDGCTGTYSCGFCDNSDPCFSSHCNTQGVCVFSTPPCLVAGTPIAMADGTTTPIERVRVGDSVLAYDVATRTVRPQNVTKTFRHAAGENHDGMVLINGTIRATGNHPVFANGRFVRADQLTESAALVELSGNASKSGTIRTIEMSGEDVETFNLEVDGDHDYFAGGILVHNKPLCP